MLFRNQTTRPLDRNDGAVRRVAPERGPDSKLDILYTDGAQHVAEHGGAYWLLDEIAIIQSYNKAVATEEFQVWTLTVDPDRSATLSFDDGKSNIVFTKKIEYTDFPLDQITLYFANNVIHLPSEY